MNEEPTKDLTGSQTFEERVLAEFAAINTQLAAIRGDIAGLDARLTTFEERLTTLEERVDARLRETRPIWEAVMAKIDRLDEKFDIVIRDIYDVRTDIHQHTKRLTELERRPRP